MFARGPRFNLRRMESGLLKLGEPLKQWIRGGLYAAGVGFKLKRWSLVV